MPEKKKTETKVVKDKITTKDDDWIAFIVLFVFICFYFYFFFIVSDDREGLWWKILMIPLFVIIGTKIPVLFHRHEGFYDP